MFCLFIAKTNKNSLFAVCTKQTSCFYAVLFSSMFQEALQLGGFFLELFGFEAVTSTFYDVQTGILVEFLGTLCKKEMFHNLISNLYSGITSTFLISTTGPLAKSGTACLGRSPKKGAFFRSGRK